MNRYYYSCVDHDIETRHEISFNDNVKFDLSEKWEAESLAQQCADDYHSNHDGWESSWPLVFALYATEDGKEIARFEVDREARPHFMARRIPS